MHYTVNSLRARTWGSLNQIKWQIFKSAVSFSFAYQNLSLSFKLSQICCQSKGISYSPNCLTEVLTWTGGLDEFLSLLNTSYTTPTVQINPDLQQHPLCMVYLGLISTTIWTVEALFCTPVKCLCLYLLCLTSFCT